MVIDYEESREKVEKVLTGELDPAAAELWPLIYYLMERMFSDPKNEEYIDKSLTLFEMLLRKVDQDEDDEMEMVIEAADKIIGWEGPVEKVLELMAQAEVNFTEPRYYQRELTNLRDYLLEHRLSTRLVGKMAELGIDLNEALIKGRTPAYIIASKQRMTGWGTNANEAEESYAKLVEEYFSVESMEALNAQGTSAAHEAVRHDHHEMLEAMLKKGVDVNVTEDQPQVAGTTLLMTACAYGFPKTVKMLMDAGADDSLRNVEDETAAHMAVSVKVRFKKISNEERVEMLKCLNHVDIPGKNGTTPLMAAQNYDLHASYILTPIFIEKGVDVNRADNNGNTALMLHAEWYCDKEVFKAMVKAGYEVNARNKAGNTVLHYAMKNKSSEVAVYLIKKGADVNIANEKQVTPMQIAVEKGMDEVLTFL